MPSLCVCVCVCWISFLPAVEDDLTHMGGRLQHTLMFVLLALWGPPMTKCVFRLLNHDKPKPDQMLKAHLNP